MKRMILMDFTCLSPSPLQLGRRLITADRVFPKG